MKSTLYFLAGGAVGAVVTYFICEARYKDKLLKQAEELHLYYQNKEKETCEEENVKEQKLTKDKNTYQAIIQSQNYAAVSAKPEEHKSPSASAFGPYPISSGEFGENGYEAMLTMNYYPTSKVLIDAEGHELSADEIDRMVGLDFAEHFGDVDDDDTVLYIRNEELKCDFEIFDNGEEEYFSLSVNGHEDD